MPVISAMGAKAYGFIDYVSQPDGLSKCKV